MGILIMSYSFPKGETDGFEVTLSNGVTYRYNKSDNLWQVASVAGDGASKDYVSKTGGDSMEGPFTINGQQGMDSRASRRLEIGRAHV